VSRRVEPRKPALRWRRSAEDKRTSSLSACKRRSKGTNFKNTRQTANKTVELKNCLRSRSLLSSPQSRDVRRHVAIFPEKIPHRFEKFRHSDDNGRRCSCDKSRVECIVQKKYETSSNDKFSRFCRNARAHLHGDAGLLAQCRRTNYNPYVTGIGRYTFLDSCSLASVSRFTTTRKSNASNCSTDRPLSRMTMLATRAPPRGRKRRICVYFFEESMEF
jgi:hypothetical protein